MMDLVVERVQVWATSIKDEPGFYLCIAHKA